jgi:hypothetical protein
MYSRSAKGGEKGDPNRNPWLAKMYTTLIKYTLGMGHINAHWRIKGVFDNLVKFVYTLGKNWQTRAWDPVF